jgi:hypothetical protein
LTSSVKDTEVISVTINVKDSIESNQPESTPKTLLLVESEDQKESLYHPIRKHILRVLSAGTSEYETSVTTEVKTLEDGTGLTHSIEVRRPVQRYWMTVPEIVGRLCQRYPDHRITSYQCYYHLQKLREQGLVDQDPPFEFDDSGRKKRTRGILFRSAARFFVYHKSGFSQDSPRPCLEFLRDGWGLEPSEEDCRQLTELILEQNRTLFNTLEHLVDHMDEIAIDSVSCSTLLDRLAHVFLSDNEGFIERYRDAKKILVRSGGGHLNTDWTLAPPHGEDDASGYETGGRQDD